MTASWRMVVVLACTVAAAALGVVVGLQHARTPPSPLLATVVVPAAPPVRPLPVAAGGDLAASVERLDRLARGRDEGAFAVLRAQLFGEARAAMADGRADAAAAILDAYLARFAGDAAALGLAADIALLQGRTDDALVALYAIAGPAASEADAAPARRRIQALADTLIAGHAQRGEVDGLRVLLERLIELDPLDDRYRLLAAQWALTAGDSGQARALLAQVPGGGALDAERQRIALAITARDDALPLSRLGVHFAIDVSGVAGGAARMLLDTGASLSTLEPAAVKRLGGRALGESIGIVTAGGALQAPLYELPLLRLGALELHDVRVAVLTVDGLGAEGLLGSDVLMRRGMRIDAERALLWLDGTAMGPAP